MQTLLTRNRAIFVLVLLLATGVAVYVFWLQPGAVGTRPPPQALLPRVAPEKQDYRFQEHMEEVPFQYEAPIPAHVITDKLRPYSDFAHYPSDHPGSLDGGNPAVPKNGPDMGTLYWKVKRRSYPAFLRALGAKTAPRLSKPAPVKSMKSELRIALTLDARCAVTLAEWQLAVAEPSRLPLAIDQLLGAYWLAGDDDAVARILAEGPAFRLQATPTDWPEAVRNVLLPKAPSPMYRSRLAVLAGNADAALSVLDGKPPHKGYAALLARARGGLAGGLDEKQQAALRQQFVTLRERFAGHALPLAKRFRDRPTAEVVAWLRWCAATFGPYSDPTADTLCYLLEHRDFQGGDLMPHIALSAGFRLRDRGAYPRAFGCYALAQNLAYPPYPPGSGSQDGMHMFNGFEASLYAGMAMKKFFTRIPRELQRELDEALLVMLDYSLTHCTDDGSAGIAGRPGYRTLTERIRWDVRARLHDSKDVMADLKEAVQQAETDLDRFWLHNRLGMYQFNHEGPDAAMQTYAKIARGWDGTDVIMDGMRKMLWVAKRTREARHFRQCIATANAVKRDFEVAKYWPNDANRRKTAIRHLNLHLQAIRQHPFYQQATQEEAAP